MQILIILQFITMIYCQWICLESSIPDQRLLFGLKSDDRQFYRVEGVNFTWEEFHSKNKQDLNFRPVNVREGLMSVTICEGDKAVIHCLFGRNIKVVGSSYGRHGRETCRHSSIRTTSCQAVNSLSVVQSRCNNQASCELHASNSVFGDPCGGTYKYLTVKYQCVLQLTNVPRPVTIYQGKKATISCQSGRQISVLETSFGRHDHSTCPHRNIHTTNYHAGNSLSVVQSRCDDPASCELDASNSVFGDTTPNTPRLVTICEGNRRIISCQSGTKISVLAASYGRHDRSTCPHPRIQTTNCHAGNSFLIVRAKCDNQASCELHASNSVFGDPCGGTYKYLSVKHQCIQ
ncbi:L-rhamnose-binding lectin CSL3-like isoform X1 [Oculina patagonica]